MKVLKSYYHLVEAELAASFLNASGINAVVLDKHLASIAAFTVVGVVRARLAVPEDQWDAASRLLQEVEVAGVEIVDEE